MLADFMIRPLTASDIGELIHLCQAHMKHEQANVQLDGKEAALSKLLFGTQPPIRCLVVEHQKQLVGYTTFMTQFSTWSAGSYLYVDCLYLTGSCRGMGLGKRLMNTIAQIAAEEQVPFIQWQTPVFNHQAIGFYQQLGALPFDKVRFIWDYPSCPTRPFASSANSGLRD